MSHLQLHSLHGEFFDQGGGRFGFNGGSALGSTFRAAQACIVTNLSASTAGLTWMIIDYRFEKKWSAVGFCSGAVAGLVAITPAAVRLLFTLQHLVLMTAQGYVGSPAAVAIGVLGATGANFATGLKHFVDIDETLDIFPCHAVAGLIGSLAT